MEQKVRANTHTHFNDTCAEQVSLVQRMEQDIGAGREAVEAAGLSWTRRGEDALITVVWVVGPSPFCSPESKL